MNVFKIVEESYDKIGEEYHNFRDNYKFITELEKFITYLPPYGRILDAGTGGGIPVAEFLTHKNYEVIGIDISEKMIKLAQKNVPQATFLKKNILTLDFPNNSFEGIICVYSLWHIPRDNHFEIMQNFNRMLKNEGILVINTGIYESEGVTDFFGEPMFWSNNSLEKTLSHVKKANFRVLFDDILIRGNEKQYWVFAKKSI
ncbi:MAG: class I SAM-dependent methyltransferase [Candidatus Heimdallarchaeota archaeon]|nr:class I SAM-dependent methyltransferase [Candidatus Heimdallarchaeota archaeon]